MPFAVLVSALGTIVAVAFAMFGLHSWSVVKVAPFIGALSGLFIAILSLRLVRLPLSSTLETYRSAVGVRGMPNLNLAFSVGAIVSVVELPGALLGWNVMHAVCVVGWLFVLGGTLYLNFRFAARTVRLDIFQFVGGIASLVIFGSFLYAFVVAPVEATVLSLIELVKTILIINGCAALVSAVTCYFLFAIASSVVTFDEVRR